MPDLRLPFVACLAFVAACAPRPEPVIPEPVYDKFGNLEDVCVSDEQRRTTRLTAAQQRLPRCEDRCAANEQPTFTAVGQWPICVPRRDDGGDDPDRPQRPTNPTRG
jgi:hypothetical protein